MRQQATSSPRGASALSPATFVQESRSWSVSCRRVGVRSHAHRGVVAAAVVACLLPAAAAADGPYEPNETAGMVAVPLVTQRVDAGLETPQDEDWYLLHPQGVRQVGVMAMLNTVCRTSYGRVTVDLLDADGPRSPLAALRLGYDPFGAQSAPRTVDTARFTSEVGHRYFLHVTQSSCDPAAYSLGIAPTGALGTRLAPTRACEAGSAAARRAVAKLTRLRASRRRAHGARRKALGAKIQRQSQQVTQTAANAKASCTRQTLAGYPWE